MHDLLIRPQFPRSNRYEPDWVLANNMGPHPLWLLEWLTNAIEMRPAMRVLDLGCGKALTSIFLAREFDAQVYAVDLWTPPDDNWSRILEAGVEQRVTPLRSEAHALPFANGFFDLILSVDAYQYFGTDLIYLHYLSRFLRPGGELGIVMPGLLRPFADDAIPAHLTEAQANGKVFWEDECITFQTVDWWHKLFRQCPRIELKLADTLADGWQLWRDFEQALEQSGKNVFPSDAETLERDAGRYLGFVRLLAGRSQAAGYNLYDPALLATIG